MATWVITLSNNPTSLGLFFFHPILQSLSIAMFTYGEYSTCAQTFPSGWMLTVATGILTLQPTSQPKTKAAGLTRHQLAMIALGVPAISLGTLAIVWRKSLNESPHFTTWHGVSHGMRSLDAVLTSSFPLDHWDHLDSLDGCASRPRRRERLVQWAAVRRKSEGETGVEVPPVRVKRSYWYCVL